MVVALGHDGPPRQIIRWFFRVSRVFYGPPPPQTRIFIFLKIVLIIRKIFWKILVGVGWAVKIGILPILDRGGSSRWHRFLFYATWNLYRTTAVPAILSAVVEPRTFCGGTNVDKFVLQTLLRWHWKQLGTTGFDAE